jgi:hypothetical protein
MFRTIELFASWGFFTRKTEDRKIRLWRGWVILRGFELRALCWRDRCTITSAAVPAP